MNQGVLFPVPETRTAQGRIYRPVLSALENQKGVMDVDTVKGCAGGMSAYPGAGCYGECYAAKTAKRYGIDFSVSVPRRIPSVGGAAILRAVSQYGANWYRVGTAGDPSHYWGHTADVCEWLSVTRKTPVIITKHWRTMPACVAKRLSALGAVVNTSTSGLDTEAETAHRVGQIFRLKGLGLTSVCRVVTCKFGDTEWARERRARQEYLLSLKPVIDNPLRLSKNSPRVASGDILIDRHDESAGGSKFVSLHSRGVYLGTCNGCPDQCGVSAKEGKKQ